MTFCIEHWHAFVALADPVRRPPPPTHILVNPDTYRWLCEQERLMRTPTKQYKRLTLLDREEMARRIFHNIERLDEQARARVVLGLIQRFGAGHDFSARVNSLFEQAQIKQGSPTPEPENAA